MMVEQGRAGRDLMAVVLALAVALLGSAALRTVTAALNDTVGTTWPFSLVHCRTAASPGCEAREAGQPTR